MNTIYQIFAKHPRTGETYSEVTCDTWEQVIEHIDVGAFNHELDPDVICVLAIHGMTDPSIAFEVERHGRMFLEYEMDCLNGELKNQREHVRIESDPSRFVVTGNQFVKAEA